MLCNGSDIHWIPKSGLDIFGAVVLYKSDKRFVDSLQARLLGQPFGRTRVIFDVDSVPGLEILCSKQSQRVNMI